MTVCGSLNVVVKSLGRPAIIIHIFDLKLEIIRPKCFSGYANGIPKGLRFIIYENFTVDRNLTPSGLFFVALHFINFNVTTLGARPLDPPINASLIIVYVVVLQ